MIHMLLLLLRTLALFEKINKPLRENWSCERISSQCERKYGWCAPYCEERQQSGASRDSSFKAGVRWEVAACEQELGPPAAPCLVAHNM